GLCIALGAFFWSAMRHTPEERDGPARNREFYVGGLAGLALGFVLWAFGEQNAAVISWYAILAVARAGVWLASFALLQNIPWTGRSRTVAISAGVLALLFNLTM